MLASEKEEWDQAPCLGELVSRFVWDLHLMCLVHSHPHYSPTSVVFLELEVGRQSLTSKDFLATDGSWAPCGASRDLVTWNEGEREMTVWIPSSLIVRFSWRWLRRGGYDTKIRKTILFWH